MNRMFLSLTNLYELNYFFYCRNKNLSKVNTKQSYLYNLLMKLTGTRFKAIEQCYLKAYAIRNYS